MNRFFILAGFAPPYESAYYDRFSRVNLQLQPPAGLPPTARVSIPRMTTPRYLHQLQPGQRATIVHVGGPAALRRRFIEMGLVRGTPILAQRVAPLGDPVAYHVKGYQLSLRREEAAFIEIQPHG